MTKRRRRSLLRGLGTIGVGGLTGCNTLSRKRQPDDEPDDSDDDDKPSGEATSETPDTPATQTTIVAPTETLRPPATPQKLAATNGMPEAEFGTSVALEGKTLMIGAPDHENQSGSDVGVVYVYEWIRGEWTLQTKLTPDNGETYTEFGASIEIDGDTVLIAAPETTARDVEEAGGAYVFAWSDGAWTKQAKLVPDTVHFGDRYGTDIALDGDTALLAAPEDEDSEEDETGGSVWVFERSDGQWSQQTELTLADIISGSPRGDDAFGSSVDLSNDVAIVGAPSRRRPDGELASGVAYVLQRSNGQWTRQTTLTPDDGDVGSGFGISVNLSDGRALITAPRDWYDDGRGGGGAYVFERPGGEWAEHARLVPDEGDPDDRFGQSIAVSGDTVIMGAWFADEPNGEDAGKAYVFEQSDGEWSKRATLVPDDGDSGDEFGISVALGDEVAIVGARHDEDPNGEEAGSAYVFGV